MSEHPSKSGDSGKQRHGGGAGTGVWWQEEGDACARVWPVGVTEGSGATSVRWREAACHGSLCDREPLFNPPTPPSASSPRDYLQTSEAMYVKPLAVLDLG